MGAATLVHRYVHMSQPSSSPSDTDRELEEVRRVVGSEVAMGGDRIVGMLAAIRKDMRESAAHHEEHRARLTTLEKGAAVSIAKQEFLGDALKAWMGRTDSKLDDIAEKVAFLDGEQTGMHQRVDARSQKEAPGIQVTVAQKVLLGGSATAVGAALSWLLGRM